MKKKIYYLLFLTGALLLSLTSFAQNLNSSYTTAPVTIDGAIDAEWDAAAILDPSAIGAAGNTYTVRSLWDENMLYLSFDVADDSIRYITQAQYEDNQDNRFAAEFIAMILTGDESALVDGLIQTGWGTGDNVFGGLYILKDDGGIYRGEDNPTFAMTRTVDNYTLEIGIPWELVSGIDKATLANGSSVIFGFNSLDIDAEGVWGASTWATWNAPAGELWDNANYAPGRIILSGKPYTSKYTTAPVTIDGAIDAEWDAAAVLYPSAEGAAGNTYTVRSLWDDNMLYLSFDVTDDSIRYITQAQFEDNVDNRFAAEFIAMILTGDESALVDGLIQTGWGTGDNVFGGLYILKDDGGIYRGEDNPTFAMTRTVDNYTLEIGIPWELVSGVDKATLANEESIIFGYNSLDIDAEGVWGASTWATWNAPAGELWDNANYAPGRIILSGKPWEAPTLSSDYTADGVTVDGDLTEWAEVTASAVIDGSETGSASYTIRSMWDMDSLYISYEVEDADFQHGGGTNKQQLAEAIYMCFGAAGITDLSAGYGANNGEVFGGVIHADSRAADAGKLFDLLLDTPIDGSNAVAVETATGYAIEVVFPWANFGHSSVDNGHEVAFVSTPWDKKTDTEWEGVWVGTWGAAELIYDAELWAGTDKIAETGTIILSGKPWEAPTLSSDYTADGVTVDGDLTEWAEVTESAVIDGSETGSASYTIRSMWDMDSLYISYEVEDADFQHGGGTNKQQLAEAIYMCFGAAGITDLSAGYGANNGEVFGGVIHADSRAADAGKLFDLLLDTPIDGSNAVAVETATGYAIEVVFPWANFGHSSVDNGHEVAFVSTPWDKKTDTEWEGVWAGTWGAAELTYDAELWAGTDKIAETGMFVLNGYTNVENKSANDLNIEVYPNPANQVLNIRSNNEISNMKIYNMSGQLLKNHIVNAREKSIDVAELKGGLYLLKVETNERVRTIRFVIE